MGKLGILTGLGPVVAGSNPADPILNNKIFVQDYNYTNIFKTRLIKIFYMVEVYKIGGDISSDPKKLELVLDLMKKLEKQGLLVVSAMRGVTDLLMNVDPNTEGELTKKHLDFGSSLGISRERSAEILDPVFQSIVSQNKHEVISLGERLMATLVREYFNRNGLASEITTGFDIGLEAKRGIINKNCAARVSRKVRKDFLDKKIFPIVTGFDGIYNGERTTLGRSGSDQTATFLAYSLGAKAIYLLKNTRGVETANPKIVPSARNIPFLTYDMAMEAGNIQLEALQHAKTGKIPIIIGYIEDPRIRTIINSEPQSDGVKLVTGFEKCTFIEVKEIRDLPGSERKILSLFEKYGINKEISFDTRNSVAFVVNTGLDKVEAVKSAIPYNSVRTEPCSLVMVVGNLGRGDKDSLESKVWEVCNPFSSASWTKGSIVSSIVVPRDSYKNVIRYLHKNLIEKP